MLLVGLGGVGMMGLAIARALFREPPIVADIDAGEAQGGDRRPARRKPMIPPIRKPARHSWRRPAAACSRLATSSAPTSRCNSATGVLARGGKLVVTGLLGGTFSIAAAMFAIKAITIEGSFTGTLAETRELLDLARSGKSRQFRSTTGR